MNKKTHIVLLVGASGSGKDTLLRAASSHLQGDGSFCFVPRYITRQPDESEKNYYIDQPAFVFLRDRAFFVSHWQAHGNYYGIGRRHLENLQPGGVAVISISRTAITDFEKPGQMVTTILVSVAPEILRSRLEGRRREGSEEIKKRLARSDLPVKARNLVRFDNSSSIDTSVASFVDLLESLRGDS